MHPSLALVGVLLGSCVAPTAEQPTTVRTWGTLREALRDGKTEARVRVADVAGPNFVAVGAIADLQGEITVVDGVCHVAYVRDGTIWTKRSNEVDATILFGADVRAWQRVEITQDIAAGDLEGFVATQAKRAGLDLAKPFPFVIDGELRGLSFHVLAGECPIRARILGQEMKKPPAHRELAKTRGKLVGIYAENGGGVITHHGDGLHVHVLVASGDEVGGHCESVAVAKGSVLRLPAGW